MMPSLLALISAGKITENDHTLALIQNISRDHAHAICRWLVLATGQTCTLRRIAITEGDELITYTPEQVQAMTRREDGTPA